MTKSIKLAAGERYKFRKSLIKRFKITDKQSNDVVALIEKYHLLNITSTKQKR